MSNKILEMQIATRALSPVEATVLVSVELESTTPTTEIRGRLVGPTCVYSTTIEVAYPLMAIPDSPLNLRRFVIPEPSLWDPVSPFLYHGVVELWQDGRMVDRRQVRHGLRFAQFNGGQLRWNGRELPLRIVDGAGLATTQLPEIRRRGINGLVLGHFHQELLDACDQFGFAALLWPRIATMTPSASPAFLGWLLRNDWREQEAAWLEWSAQQREPVGIVHDGKWTPETVQFQLFQNSHWLQNWPPELP